MACPFKIDSFSFLIHLNKPDGFGLPSHVCHLNKVRAGGKSAAVNGSGDVCYLLVVDGLAGEVKDGDLVDNPIGMGLEGQLVGNQAGIEVDIPVIVGQVINGDNDGFVVEGNKAGVAEAYGGIVLFVVLVKIAYGEGDGVGKGIKTVVVELGQALGIVSGVGVHLNGIFEVGGY